MTSQDPRDATVFYKILTPEQHESLPGRDDSHKWQGVGIDIPDGFIHLSTTIQLQGTLDRFFSEGGDTLYISHLPRATVESKAYKLQFDPAAGTVFPHIYGGISPGQDFVKHDQIRRGADGKFVLPELTF